MLLLSNDQMLCMIKNSKEEQRFSQNIYFLIVFDFRTFLMRQVRFSTKLFDNRGGAL